MIYEMKKMIPIKISGEKIYSCKWLSLNVDKIQLGNGNIIEQYHNVDFFFDTVIIIMLNKKKEVCMVKVPRYLSQSVELELPAGSMAENETVLEAAKRETLEETGYELANAKMIYSFYPSNAISKNKSHVVIGNALNDEPKQEIDTNEIAEINWMSNKKLLEMLKTNEIKDGHTTNALLYYFTFLA